jgi:hypothetical protein
MSQEMNNQKKYCCFDVSNLKEETRTEEKKGIFVWMKCKVCNQLMLTTLPKKKKCLHEQKS